MRVLGLEIADWTLLAVAAGILFALVPNILLGLAAAAGLWAWLYFFKARKPEGYTAAVLAHFTTPRVLGVEKELKLPDAGANSSA